MYNRIISVILLGILTLVITISVIHPSSRATAQPGMTTIVDKISVSMAGLDTPILMLYEGQDTAISATITNVSDHPLDFTAIFEIKESGGTREKWSQEINNLLPNDSVPFRSPTFKLGKSGDYTIVVTYYKGTVINETHQIWINGMQTNSIVYRFYVFEASLVVTIMLGVVTGIGVPIYLAKRKSKRRR